jgi:large subunit ribosomal protein L24
MRKIKKGDTVLVTAGKDKGKKGTVNKVVAKRFKQGKGTVQKFKLLIEGINLVKKHKKGDPAAGTQGTIMEKEAPIDVSNVAIFNAMTGKADRIGFKTLEDGRKVRIFKSTSELVDV